MSINGLMYRNFCSYSFMLASLIFYRFFPLLSTRFCLLLLLPYSIQTCEVNFHLDMSNKVKLHVNDAFSWKTKKKASFNLIYFLLPFFTLCCDSHFYDRQVHEMTSTRFYFGNKVIVHCVILMLVVQISFPLSPHLASFPLSLLF